MGPTGSEGPAAGRRVLITGASSGIGAATAQAAAAAGYRVALFARRRDALVDLVAGLPGEGHLALGGDVTDELAVARAMEATGEAFGALDLLVNNAGVGYRARVEELEVDTARRVLATNILGPLLIARAALPLLRRGLRPVLVNVSSVVARRGIPGQAVYGASKAALSSIGEALRLEWATDDIAVCNLEPALTATGFFEAQANPAGLPHPDLGGSDSAAAVAAAILGLDRSPRPEVSLRWKWRLLAAVGSFAPRLADRLLARRLGGGWQAPGR